MLEWMRDFEEFQKALASDEHRDADGEPTYMNSLMNSMSLVLDEFYQGLKVSLFTPKSLFLCLFNLLFTQAVSVSSYTGAGVPEFFEAVEAARKEYES